MVWIWTEFNHWIANKFVEIEATASIGRMHKAMIDWYMQNWRKSKCWRILFDSSIFARNNYFDEKSSLDALFKYLMEFETWCIDVSRAKLQNWNKYSSTITGVIHDNGGIESLMNGVIVNIWFRMKDYSAWL
jgi:hypothetical protein